MMFSTYSLWSLRCPVNEAPAKTRPALRFPLLHFSARNEVWRKENSLTKKSALGPAFFRQKRKDRQNTNTTRSDPSSKNTQIALKTFDFTESSEFLRTLFAQITTTPDGERRRLNSPCLAAGLMVGKWGPTCVFH